MDTQSPRTTLEILDKSEYLSTAIRTQMPIVTPPLEEAFGVLPPRGEGEQARPSWAGVQEANADLLDFAIGKAHGAGQAHRVAKVQVSEALDHRNVVADGLRGRYRNLRHSAEGAYTVRVLALVGLDAPPSRRYLGVREQIRDAIVRMRHPELSSKLGEPVAGQEPLDFEQIAQNMAEALAVFEAALDAVREARKRRDEALVAKQEAERYLRRVYANVARAQEGYYRLAGLDDLADRLRLTIPRSSQPRETEPAPDSETPS